MIDGVVRRYWRPTRVEEFLSSLSRFHFLLLLFSSFFSFDFGLVHSMGIGGLVSGFGSGVSLDLHF